MSACRHAGRDLLHLTRVQMPIQSGRQVPPSRHLAMLVTSPKDRPWHKAVLSARMSLVPFVLTRGRAEDAQVDVLTSTADES